jgi:capsular polysaccharide biosynthesis protein
MTTVASPRSDHDFSSPAFPEPPPNPFQAVARHPFLTLLPILVLVGAAVALGLTREPTYTSDARLSVGDLNPGQQTAPGVVEANQQLASAYSRAITAEEVVQNVSERTRMPPGVVASRLSASPVPKSPLMTVKATGPTRAQAVRLANAATGALVGYVRSVSAANAGANDALRRYQEAQAAVKRAEDRLNNAVTPADIDKARSALAGAKLKARGLKGAYLAQAGSSGTTPVAVLNRAEDASSDSTKTLRLYVVIGGLAGVFLGVALATSVASRRHRGLQQGD